MPLQAADLPVTLGMLLRLLLLPLILFLPCRAADSLRSRNLFLVRGFIHLRKGSPSVEDWPLTREATEP
jgi:hypothetical protein